MSNKQFCFSGCGALTDSESGAWTSSSCTSGVSKVGDSCSIQCKENFILKGAASIQCTENGWNSVNGDNIPSCVRKYTRILFICSKIIIKFKTFFSHRGNVPGCIRECTSILCYISSNLIVILLHWHYSPWRAFAFIMDLLQT